MATIVLIYPATGLDIRKVSVWLPLSVLQIAATLVEDYDVVIVDQRVDDTWKATLRRVVTDETLCVGISSMTGTQIRGALAVAAEVREIHPTVPLVWGGNHPTLAPDSTARHPLVDIVVMGEGEVVFRKLVEALEKGTDWRALPDIAFEKDGEVVKNGTGTDPQRFVDPATWPPLPYHLLDIEEYISGPMIFGRKLRSLPYIGSRGCPHECAFCCQPIFSKRRWRQQPPEMVYQRTSALMEKYRLDAIEFHDEEFFVDRRRGALLAGLIGGRFDWYVQTRMDDLLALDLEMLYRSGLRVVQPGLETGSPRILDMIRKGETVEMFHEANRRLAGSGIHATYNFMMGFPGETIADVTDTVDLALTLLDENPNACVAGFYVYVPYPGAELYALAVRDGFNEPQTLEDWSVFNRQHLGSPWIQQHRDLFEMLLYSSKFIGGSRLRSTFQGRPFHTLAITALSAFYRRRWRKHDFRKTPEIDLLAFAARKIFRW